MKRQYIVGSLFAGVGGICLGFQNAGFKMAWANEIDEYAAETYRNNFKHPLIEGDIEKIVKISACENEEENIEYEKKLDLILSYKIDVLTGGFPCQPFSIAGERKGFADKRGNLFWSIVELVKLLDKHQEKPKVLFLENVKNLKSHDNGNTYSRIVEELQDLGYTVKDAVLNTMEYTNLPQNRERIYIVGFLNQHEADRFTMFDKDERGNYINLINFKRVRNEKQRKLDIKRIIDFNENINKKYYYNKEKYPRYFLTKEEYDKIPAEDKKDEIINLTEQIKDKYEFYQVRRGMYVRKNQNGVCPTLTANMGMGGHNVPLIKDNKGIRKLTPAEAFKLQGFPINYGYRLPVKYKGKPYTDARLYKQAGNAVSVPVIELIASEILSALENNK